MAQWTSGMASEISRYDSFRFLSSWGYTKSIIYETPVESEMDLVARIVAAAGKIAERSAFDSEEVPDMH